MRATHPSARNCANIHSARRCSKKVEAAIRQTCRCCSLIHCLCRTNHCSASRRGAASANSPATFESGGSGGSATDLMEAAKCASVERTTVKELEPALVFCRDPSAWLGPPPRLLVARCRLLMPPVSDHHTLREGEPASRVVSAHEELRVQSALVAVDVAVTQSPSPRALWPAIARATERLRQGY